MGRASTWSNSMASLLMICMITIHTPTMFPGCISNNSKVAVATLPTILQMWAPMVFALSQGNTPTLAPHIMQHSLLIISKRVLEAITLGTKWRTLCTPPRGHDIDSPPPHSHILDVHHTLQAYNQRSPSKTTQRMIITYRLSITLWKIITHCQDVKAAHTLLNARQT